MLRTSARLRSSVQLVVQEDPSVESSSSSRPQSSPLPAHLHYSLQQLHQQHQQQELQDRSVFKENQPRNKKHQFQFYTNQTQSFSRSQSANSNVAGKMNNTDDSNHSSPARLEISDVDPWDDEDDNIRSDGNVRNNRNYSSGGSIGGGVIGSAIQFLQTKRGLVLLFSTLALFIIAISTSLNHDDISLPHPTKFGSKQIHNRNDNNYDSNTDNDNGNGKSSSATDQPDSNGLVPPKKGMAYLTPPEFLDIRTAHPGESVLVTGGLGFIGSHVVDLLLHRGFHVTILDDESNGHNHNSYVDIEMVPNDITVVGDLPDLPTGVGGNGSSSGGVLSWEGKHTMDLKKTHKKIKKDENGDRYFTHVIHLAAAISVAESMKDPEKYERINYGGSEKVLDWIVEYNQRVSELVEGYHSNDRNQKERDMQQKSHKSSSSNNKHSIPLIRKVVAASSAAIYGDPDPSLLPLQESAPYGGLSPYADTKYRMEGLMRDFVKKQNDFNTKAASSSNNNNSKAIPAASATALRFFNVYGPRQDPKNPYSGVISLFLEAAVNDHDITILGDGEMTRDFVYVKDVARAIVMALLQEEEEGEEKTDINRENTQREASFSVYNVCTGKSITINTLASQVKKSMESMSKITHLAPRDGDIRESSCNPNGAKEGMGYVAAVKGEEGLEKTANWFRLERDERNRRRRLRDGQ